MAISRNTNGKTRRDVEMVGALALVGLAVGAAGLRFAGRAQRGHEPEHRRAAFAAYLREHLSGADAAIGVVDRLKNRHEGTPEGALFASLDREFRGDRAVVLALLERIGASPLSVKRLAGEATGRMLRAAAGGDRGTLRLFRTLEALAIGVQGKRCLWRMAQALVPPVHAPGARNFAELEERAVDQWEAIERCRRSLVPQTFGM